MTFIQHTKHSRLVNRVREKLADIQKVGKIKVKMVERSGEKLVDLLHKYHPWSQKECDRKDCWPCTSAGEENKKKENATKGNIVYETYCVTCEKEEEKKKIKLDETEENISNNDVSKKRKVPEKIRKKKKGRYIISISMWVKVIGVCM